MTMLAKDDLLRGLAQVRLFQGLSPLQLRGLAEHCRIREITAGTVLFREGDPGRSLVAILSGTVQIVKATSQGERVLADRGAGEVIGDLALIIQRPRSATAIALTDVRLLVLERGAFETALRTSHHLAIELVRTLGSRLVEASESDLKRSSLTKRLSQWLLEQDRHGTGSVTLPVSKTQLATQLGVRRETLSRLLSELASEGILRVERKQIQILGRETLESYASEGSTQPPASR